MSHIPSPTSDDGDNAGLSSTPTPYSRLQRSVSHGSQWSATDTPHHHNQGTSYFGSPSPSRSNPMPILVRSLSAHSVKQRGTRSTSISSASRANAFLDGDTVSEADEDEEDGSPRRRGKGPATAEDDEEDGEDSDERDDESDREDDPITLKERQSLINVEHPFGLPIWKPALYKKSRSVTRHADEALHSVPSAQAERHLLPGNIFWVIFFGWWLSIVCFAVSLVLRVLPKGGAKYSSLIFGLGWYIAWPFGKYVEGDAEEEASKHTEDSNAHERHNSAESSDTIRGAGEGNTSTIRAQTDSRPQHVQAVSWNSASTPGENSALLSTQVAIPPPAKSYGATVYPSSRSSSSSSIGFAKQQSNASDWLGKAVFWAFLISVIAPLMLFVCLICWGLVITIPMAKLNWALIKHLFERPHSIRFCSAPPSIVVSEPRSANTSTERDEPPSTRPKFAVKHPRISPGQVAPSGSPSSTVLLCVYRAIGWQYYKYTVGGVNIMFVNLLPVVIFAIFDGLVLLNWAEKYEHAGKPVPPFLAFIASKGLIFLLGLLSVIPLSYFIGMAVASISAQSSIGMGAVINATFGSIIEIILYAIALTQSKGHLVEGSIVGSLLAGVLLMPGMSMCSAAVRLKEQKFNAKSAGVTSMMLIMAIIGTLTPTIFYQTYGSFQLVCRGCPSAPRPGGNAPWICDHCYYQHPDPVDDPFYQSTVKSFMYFCAAVLLFSYLIGLWFSLHTHHTQIWQNPQQLLYPTDLPVHNRQSIYQRLIPHSAGTSATRGLHHKASNITNPGVPSRPTSPVPREHSQATSTGSGSSSTARPPVSPPMPRRVSYAPQPPVGYTPVMESVDHAVRNAANIPGLNLPESMNTDDFTRAVAVATVSALRHQQTVAPTRLRSSEPADGDAHGGGHGGHDAPSWSRTTSASVLLACTALYAVIAEILVDVVDVILDGSGIPEKFLGITLFALVPNTTEFMNAMGFALNGNIALSMEIGSAYALQVCLLQIPAMVAFSAIYAPEKMGQVSSTFTLIFPRWDVVAIIFAMFLMTYTYIEAKSNYHRGSILILSYLVLIVGFYHSPGLDDLDDPADELREFTNLSGLQAARWWITSWS